MSISFTVTQVSILTFCLKNNTTLEEVAVALHWNRLDRLMDAYNGAFHLNGGKRPTLCQLRNQHRALIDAINTFKCKYV